MWQIVANRSLIALERLIQSPRPRRKTKKLNKEYRWVCICSVHGVVVDTVRRMAFGEAELPQRRSYCKGNTLNDL